MKKPEDLMISASREWNSCFKSFLDDCWNRDNPCREQINIINSIITTNTYSENYKSPQEPLITLILFESQFKRICDVFNAYSLKVLYMPAGQALLLSADLMYFDFYNNKNLSAEDIYKSILDRPMYNRG